MESRSSIPIQQSHNSKEAVCDGGSGVLGHPKVYLPFGKKSEVTCYYCGRRFEKKSNL